MSKTATESSSTQRLTPATCSRSPTMNVEPRMTDQPVTPEDEIRADERRKVAEEIAVEIERVIGSYPDNVETRPRYERGGFLNDAQWAALIARQIGARRG